MASTGAKLAAGVGVAVLVFELWLKPRTAGARPRDTDGDEPLPPADAPEPEGNTITVQGRELDLEAFDRALQRGTVYPFSDPICQEPGVLC